MVKVYKVSLTSINYSSDVNQIIENSVNYNYKSNFPYLVIRHVNKIIYVNCFCTNSLPALCSKILFLDQLIIFSFLLH